MNNFDKLHKAFRDFAAQELKDKHTAATGKSGKPDPVNESAEVFRGSSNINLSRQGYQEAHDAARRTVGTFTHIYTSPLKRARDTAYAVARKNPQAGAIKVTPALEPWFLGQHEGQPVTKARLDDIHDHVMNRPDEKVPGRGPRSTGQGESFHDFLHPLLDHIISLVRNHKDTDKPLNVTHYRDIQALKAWLDAGAKSDKSINRDIMVSKGDQHPGGLYRLDPHAMTLHEEKKSDKPGIYFLRHGATAWNAENKGPSPNNSGEKPKKVQA